MCPEGRLQGSSDRPSEPLFLCRQWSPCQMPCHWLHTTLPLAGPLRGCSKRAEQGSMLCWRRNWVIYKTKGKKCVCLRLFQVVDQTVSPCLPPAMESFKQWPNIYPVWDPETVTGTKVELSHKILGPGWVVASRRESRTERPQNPWIQRTWLTGNGEPWPPAPQQCTLMLAALMGGSLASAGSGWGTQTVSFAWTFLMSAYLAMHESIVAFSEVKTGWRARERAAKGAFSRRKGCLLCDDSFVLCMHPHSCRTSLLSAICFWCRAHKFSKILYILTQILWWSGSVVAFGAKKADLGSCPGGRAR